MAVVVKLLQPQGADVSPLGHQGYYIDILICQHFITFFM